MTTDVTHLNQDPRYKSFLYAPIGQDRSGASVTVLSMLARLGVDPWGEASELAALPRRAAGQRLETLINRFHGVPDQAADRTGLIAGLLTLLPRHTASAKASPSLSADETPERFAFPAQGAGLYWIALALLVVGWIVFLARG